MRFSTIAAALLPIVAVSAADILVTVGDNGTLAFVPSSVTAAVGDTISFEFKAKNHSVTQSTFASPCSKIATTGASQAVDSGFQPVAAGATEFPQFSFTMTNASAPLWFFCAQTNPVDHCNQGMVFAVNPTATKSFAAFQAAAMAAGNSSSSAGTASSSSTASGSSASGFSTKSSASATGSATGTSASAPATSSGAASHMSGSLLSVLAGFGLLVGLTL